MRKAGIDQAVRMKISGHKTDGMERRYNTIDVQDIKQAAQQLNTWAQQQKTKHTSKKTQPMDPDSSRYSVGTVQQKRPSG
jgi:hypothetical protein